MFGRKKNEADNERRPPQKKNPKNDSLMDQLRDEMSSSCDDMQSALDDHLAGQSRDRRGGSKPPESVDYPWSSELDVDAEVHGSSPQMREEPDHALSPRARQSLSGHRDTPRLSSRASQTARPSAPPAQGTLVGKDYEKHMAAYKAHLAGKKGKFKPDTEEAFNTDARNLREYNTKIKVAGQADTVEVRQAKEAKEQLLQTYRELGHNQNIENYPRSNHPDFSESPEIWTLKEVFREGHGEAGQQKDVSNLNRYKAKDVEEIETLGAQEATHARDRRSAPRAPKGSRSYPENRRRPEKGYESDRRHLLLPPNWDQMSPTEQRDYLNQLIDDERVDPKEFLNVLPEHRSPMEHKEVSRERKGPRLFSRASKTARKGGQGVLTGPALTKHRKKLEGKGSFDPKTEAEFNTDAKKLRDCNSIIEIAKGQNITGVPKAKAERQQLLQAYRELGRKQDAKRNYPDSVDHRYETSPEMWALKTAYKDGHADTELQVDTSEVESYTEEDLADIERVGRDDAEWAREKKQAAINKRRR